MRLIVKPGPCKLENFHSTEQVKIKVKMQREIKLECDQSRS